MLVIVLLFIPLDQLGHLITPGFTRGRDGSTESASQIICGAALHPVAKEILITACAAVAAPDGSDESTQLLALDPGDQCAAGLRVWCLVVIESEGISIIINSLW